MKKQNYHYKEYYLKLIISVILFLMIFTTVSSLPNKKVSSDMIYSNRYYCENGFRYILMYNEGIDIDEQNAQFIATDLQCENLAIEKLGSFTNSYNCHYYAFFLSNEYRANILINPNPNDPNPPKFWLEDPSNFILSGDRAVYQSTNRFNADIVVYFDVYGDPIHSAKVIKAMNGVSNNVCQDLNLIEVESKWGLQGLFHHYGDSCPYVFAYGGTTSSIVYYNYIGSDLHPHSHNLTYSTIDSNFHQKVCLNNDPCNIDLVVPHVYSFISINNNQHDKICEDCGYHLAENHTMSSYKKYNSNYHKHCCSKCDYYVLDGHRWNQLNDHLFVCQDCNQSARSIPIHMKSNLELLTSNQVIISYQGQTYLLTMIGE